MFDQLVEVEGGDNFDLTTVVITDVDDASASITVPKETGTTGGEFAARIVGLADLEGRTIQIELQFDTVDGIANDLEGWFVDQVQVISSEPGDSCEHDVCEVGDALDPTCAPCAETVCAADPYCCDTAWDEICVQEAADLCGADCTTCGNDVCDPGEDCDSCPGDCGECTPSCEHDLCEPGIALEPSCDPCATAVCAEDDFCCSTFWDRICVQEAEEICGLTCSGCEHDLCDVGGPLEPSCDPCAETVCAVDDYCCNNAWDARCVSEAAQLCGLECAECTHDLCDVGDALVPSCDPCATAVCEQDAFCCTNAWDSRCVEQAGEICGLTCQGAR